MTGIAGSSPRVWGQDIKIRIFGKLLGIIPTRVGTSIALLHRLNSDRDHPHACGDKIPVLVTVARIIPTRVGTSFTSRDYLAQSEDHPHACGDKFAALELVYDVLKSSPRVWGQVELPMGAANAARIIPTCVGTRMFYMRLMQKK